MQNLPNIVRDRLRVATPGRHPDADTLTAFSEQLLPEKERAAVLNHLAQCSECREVVALALPEAEIAQPVLGKTGSRWVGWPTLRWAFVAAGIAIVSVGVVEYQHGTHKATMMAYQALSVKEETAAKGSPAPPAIGAQNNQRETAALVAKDETLPSEPSPEKARTFTSRMKQFHGSGPLGGPSSANQFAQWQQQNANQNQGSAPALGNANAQAAQAEAPPSPQAAPFNTQLAKNQPVTGLADNGLAVDKAKLPVPPVSPASGMLNRQDRRDAIERLGPQAAPGQIGGYVVDPSGAVVSNARITITPSQTGGPATAVTNSQGAWLIAGLPSGSYRAEAEAPGFKTTILDLNYDANQPSMFSFTLSPGNVSETVEVSSAQMQVQAQGGGIGQAEMKPAESSSQARALNMEQLAALSPARMPRWSITAAGALQRSFDQGSTWQDVDVSGAPLAFARGDLDVSANTQSAKMARAKVKSAGKKDASSPVFRAVTANGADVWAGGVNGSLYHSTDFGNRWTRVVPTSGGSILAGDIVSLEFPDPQHGKLSTSTAEIWITADSGQTWQKQ